MWSTRQLVSTTLRSLSTKSASGQYSGGAAPPPPPSSDPIAAVKGLSQNIVSVPNDAVGPGAKKDGAYKVPEYYCYNTMSFFEAEIEMAKFRCPQPDAQRK